MKRHYVFLVFILVFFCIICGCQKIPASLFKKAKPAKKGPPAVTRIESVELAEAIMRSEPYAFSLARDPFKPIVEKEVYSAALPQAQDKEINPLADLKLKGTMLVDNVYFALVGYSVTTKVYKTGDMIADYKIVQIDSNKLLLKKQNDEVILKIEGERKNE